MASTSDQQGDASKQPRKRLVLLAVALVILAVAAYFLSPGRQPH